MQESRIALNVLITFTLTAEMVNASEGPMNVMDTTTVATMVTKPFAVCNIHVLDLTQRNH